jgi:hypothetical protein
VVKGAGFGPIGSPTGSSGARARSTAFTFGTGATVNIVDVDGGALVPATAPATRRPTTAVPATAMWLFLSAMLLVLLLKGDDAASEARIADDRESGPSMLPPPVHCQFSEFVVGLYGWSEPSFSCAPQASRSTLVDELEPVKRPSSNVSLPDTTVSEKRVHVPVTVQLAHCDIRLLPMNIVTTFVVPSFVLR